MKELPKLLQEVFGKYVELVEDILDKAKNDGFDISDENRLRFYEKHNTTEYIYYKIKRQMEDIGIVEKREDKLYINPYFDLKFSREWREWYE